MSIQEYQKRCFRDYSASLDLGKDYKFLYGNPILPVVPLDTATGGLFIIGAYPSARFASIGKVSDVPVDNNLGPFSEEIYFDGSRVRKTASSEELQRLLLEPLGLKRSDCWITDLVKVFLFKEGHVERYKALGAKPLPPANRDRFEEYAKRSLRWLEEELILAQPKMVVTLGAEVAGILRDVRSSSGRNALLTGTPSPLTVGKTAVRAAHLAHPGILMRTEERNPWPKLHQDEHLPRLKNAFNCV